MLSGFFSSAEHLQTLAQTGQFPGLLYACQQSLQAQPDNLALQLDIAALLSAYGFLTEARHCLERAQTLAPNDLRARINLANVLREAGEHHQASQLYAQLRQQLPNNAAVRRNALTSLEYDPGVTDAERLDQASAWGTWAQARAGGAKSRPKMTTLQQQDGSPRPLRIGYVSADLCQHTVGLFVKDVLQAHDPQRIQVFAYSAAQLQDWVTDAISSACIWRDVRSLDDPALAQQIRQDQIDVLVDLSGHTAGSRLTVFAYRPAPVQVSWLGYFASTGLASMDAVLLDEWHAPAGTESQFVEPIIRLPGGRFCYQPVPWAPAEVAPLPSDSKDFITFGCFNNTAKFNDGVFDVWAQVLAAVPQSRLVLKWRTFHDEALRQQVTQAFAQRSIAADRLELRGPSFHQDLLEEYADIDIALDPFPFTGGLTSCEALWMGVPVITWPQSRVVSRQTWAFLNQIGLPALGATNAADYVRIASTLAHDKPRLRELRQTLRQRMRTSPLTDVAGFTRQLEDSLIALYQRIQAEQTEENLQDKPISQQTKKTTMPSITIDNQTYDLDSLSQDAKTQLQMLQLTEAEIQRLNVQLAIAQTARNAYRQALKAALPSPLEQLQAQGDTLKLG